MMSPCRFCGSTSRESFADLGMSPLSNAFVKPEKASGMEPFYPLHAFVCNACFLVQLEEFRSPDDLFREYAYLSSYSETWLGHSRTFAENMCARLRLTSNSSVVEVASNDGYLLQYFAQKNIGVLGIEPAKNAAELAREKGIPTKVCFFGETTAGELVSEGIRADLLVGNNVLAHVPDINDFVRGMKLLLAPGGLVSLEFPHLLRLMEQNQFDTIYHEHFSYFSLATARRILEFHGLSVVDVDELPTHGGSLRVFARHAEESPEIRASVQRELSIEDDFGLSRVDTYARFAERPRESKMALLSMLIDLRRAKKTIAAYGAPAKGNTLLNYCGVGVEFVDFTVDRNPQKQGCLLPGVRIPVFSPEKLEEARPDYILVLPWNLKDEIKGQLAHVRRWGCKFIIPIPEARIET